MKNLFVVIVRYIVDLSEIDANLAEHKKLLDTNYKNDIFITSGPQVPRIGGIIIAKSKSREDLIKVLSQDTFAINKLAEYQVYEFTPLGDSKEFKSVIG
jgi:uncharacterized protein YciI